MSSIIPNFEAMLIPREIISLDIASVNKVCGKADQIAIYGYECCKYDLVLDCFKRSLRENKDFSVKKCFDCDLGETLEGRDMCKLDTKRWKDALVELVFENYLRVHEGKKIIPLIFCVDIDGNEYKFTIESATEKSVRLTDTELRRCYKLMYDLGEDKTAKELSIIAKATFKFVKLIKSKDEDSKYSFETIAPFSKDAWQKAMEIRRKGKTPKSTEWIKELMSLLPEQPSVSKSSDKSESKQDTSKFIENLLSEIDSKKDT